MFRYALAAVLGLAVVIASGTGTDAQEKKTEKKADGKATTVEGKLVCTKCTLSETKACEHAVKVKDGEKTVTYYIAKNKDFHKEVCPAGSELDVKVTGTVTEKDGKKTITGAKVEKK